MASRQAAPRSTEQILGHAILEMKRKLAASESRGDFKSSARYLKILHHLEGAQRANKTSTYW